MKKPNWLLTPDAEALLDQFPQRLTGCIVDCFHAASRDWTGADRDDVNRLLDWFQRQRPQTLQTLSDLATRYWGLEEDHLWEELMATKQRFMRSDAEYAALAVELFHRRQSPRRGWL